MTTERIHRTTTDDGIEIAGRVHGAGPPVVLVHGAMADGDTEWAALLPLLTGRFTCYLPSTRGRGLSGTHPDLSREARVRDLTAFIDSIGEPVTLVGVSGGGMLALGAAARSPAVARLVAHEPVVFEVMDARTRAGFQSAVAQLAQAAAAGDPAQAAGAFLEFVANADEAAALSADPDGIDEVTENVFIDLAEFLEALEPDGFSPTDPALLARITVPALLTQGAETAQQWFVNGTHYAARHIPDAALYEIGGIGHLGHLVAPERVAEALIPFLEPAHEPV